MSAVGVTHLSKNYPLSGSPFARFRRLFAAHPVPSDGIWAVRDVSFSVERGEAFGIIGANGSGKSTLLKIIAGIVRPTSGSLSVEGRLSSLLELGSGFSPEFTGRENVYLNASILGLSRHEIDQRFDMIRNFAEIGDFIDQPIRTYSTGMVLRLAFAVTAHVDPEILIIDEALAVGDIAFRQRCMRRIHDLRARGTTILFVSHAVSDVKALCERCLWLHEGVVQHVGETDETVERYLAATLHREVLHTRGAARPAGSLSTNSFALEGRHRHGDGRMRLTGTELLTASGLPVEALVPHERVVLKVRFHIHRPVPSPIVGFLVRNARGENIFGTNTARENHPVPPLTPGSSFQIDFHWTAPEISQGRYFIAVGMADGNVEEYAMCDFIDGVLNFTVVGDSCHRGYFRLRCVQVAIYRS